MEETKITFRKPRALTLNEELHTPRSFLEIRDEDKTLLITNQKEPRLKLSGTLQVADIFVNLYHKNNRNIATIRVSAVLLMDKKTKAELPFLTRTQQIELVAFAATRISKRQIQDISQLLPVAQLTVELVANETAQTLTAQVLCKFHAEEIMHIFRQPGYKPGVVALKRLEQALNSSTFHVFSVGDVQQHMAQKAKQAGNTDKELPWSMGKWQASDMLKDDDTEETQWFQEKWQLEDMYKDKVVEFCGRLWCVRDIEIFYCQKAYLSENMLLCMDQNGNHIHRVPVRLVKLRPDVQVVWLS